jgi:two-component system response regulator DegU
MSMQSGQPERIRILLCEDQTLMRQGLRTILELEDDFVVVGEAINGEDAVQHYQALKQQGQRPDVVLMDIQMPRMNGVEATAILTSQDQGARIIMLTTFDYEDYVFEAVKAGAMGYLLKDVPSHELAGTIRKVYTGEPFIQPKIATRLLIELGRKGRTTSTISAHPATDLPVPVVPVSETQTPEELSSREIEVIKLLANGASNREIADTLVLAEGTVKNHVSNILGKLHAENRTQAANMARKRGLI